MQGQWQTTLHPRRPSQHKHVLQGGTDQITIGILNFQHGRKPNPSLKNIRIELFDIDRRQLLLPAIDRLLFAHGKILYQDIYVVAHNTYSPLEKENLHLVR